MTDTNIIILETINAIITSIVELIKTYGYIAFWISMMFFVIWLVYQIIVAFKAITGRT